MKFSVLMSLYIKENPQYLRECFESLVAQTHPADEIVLVFDGAVTPELEAVVSEFETKLPLNLVKLPKNLGLGKRSMKDKTLFTRLGLPYGYR